MNCLKTGLTTQPEFGRFVHYKLLTLIPVIAALVAIARHSETIHWPMVYIALCLSHAAVMFTIKCPHCAYYKLGGKNHRCFMFWGVPKIYRPRVGPEGRIVSIYAPIGMAVLTFFPVYWLWFEWELLLIYLLSIAVILSSIGLNECPRCINFDCPHNQVSEETRKAYVATLPHGRTES